MQTIEQGVISIDKQTWLTSLNESVRHIKHVKEHRLEKYMENIKEDKYSINLE